MSEPDASASPTPSATARLARRLTGAPDSLRARVFRGSAWTISGYALTQAFHLFSHLVLAYLLFPEAFGLMALVTVVTRGLQMFSDMGISASIISNKRGVSDDFLNTAWTLQIFRGFALWTVACLLAWPAAQFYEESALKLLIPVAAFSAVISGFNSTRLATHRRDLKLGKPTLLTLFAQLLSFACVATLALLWRSVWALVIGQLLSSLFGLFMSHWWLEGIRNRICWNKECAKSLVSFGRWIFLSTALTFLLQHGDRLVLGKFLTAAELGLYSIAAMIARSTVDAALKMTREVLFPAYSQLGRSNPEQMYSRVRRTRLVLLACLLPPTWFVALFGSWVVEMLYDVRYHEVGWMLETLSIGTIGTVIGLATGSVLLGVGDSYRFMLLQVTRSVLLVLGMYLGGEYYGLSGMVFGITAARLCEFPFVAWSVRKYNMWMPEVDVIAYGTSAIVIGGGLWAMGYF